MATREEKMARIHELKEKGLSNIEAILQSDRELGEGYENPKYDPKVKAHVDSITKEEPKFQSKQFKGIEERYEEAKESVGEKYESAKSTIKQISGFESREPLKKGIIRKIDKELEKLEESQAKKKALKELERKKAEDIQRRLKSAHIEGLEQRAYYKGYGGEVAKAKQARLAAKERRTEELHKLKLQGFGGLSIAKPSKSLQKVVKTEELKPSNPFGLSTTGIISTRPIVRQPQRQPEDVASVLGLREYVTPKYAPSTKVAHRESSDPLGLGGFSGSKAPRTKQGNKKSVHKENGSSLVDMGSWGNIDNPVGNVAPSKKGKKTKSGLGTEGYF